MTEARFTVSVRCEANEAVVAVVDEGTIIPNALLARAFEAALARRFPERAYTLRLPIAGGSGRATESMPPPTYRSSARRRILVVDDNADAAQSLGFLLRQMGHDVQVAHDGHAALEAARMNRPQLVLLDLGMPGLDGFRVVERLRKEAQFADVPMVAVTGSGEPDVRRRSREAGFTAHVVKPVSLETLRTLLEQL